MWCRVHVWSLQDSLHSITARDRYLKLRRPLKLRRAQASWRRASVRARGPDVAWRCEQYRSVLSRIQSLQLAESPRPVQLQHLVYSTIHYSPVLLLCCACAERQSHRSIIGDSIRGEANLHTLQYTKPWTTSLFIYSVNLFNPLVSNTTIYKFVISFAWNFRYNFH